MFLFFWQFLLRYQFEGIKISWEMAFHMKYVLWNVVDAGVFFSWYVYEDCYRLHGTDKKYGNRINDSPRQKGRCGRLLAMKLINFLDDFLIEDVKFLLQIIKEISTYDF